MDASAPMMPMPDIITPTAVTRPKAVTGKRSP